MLDKIQLEQFNGMAIRKLHFLVRLQSLPQKEQIMINTENHGFDEWKWNRFS